MTETVVLDSQHLLYDLLQLSQGRWSGSGSRWGTSSVTLLTNVTTIDQGMAVYAGHDVVIVVGSLIGNDFVYSGTYGR